MSDVGGSAEVNGVELLLDDAAANALPVAGPLVAGTFQPTNFGRQATFPCACAGAYGHLGALRL